MNNLKVRPQCIVIDDEPDILKFIKLVLNDEGFDVKTASDSREGLLLLEQEHPDLLCLDIMMPGQTGLSLYREMREFPHLKDVPVLIISGLDMKDSVNVYLNGAKSPDGYLEKPLDPLTLTAKVRSILGPEVNH